MTTDVLEINTLELPKLPEEPDNSKLWSWMKFLDAKEEGEMQALVEGNPRIGKAVGVLKELSGDERTRLLAEAREKAWKDEQGRLQYSFEQGILKGVKQGVKQGIKQGIVKGIEQGIVKGIKQGVEQGIVKGIEQERWDIIQRMRTSGFNTFQIMDATGLTEQEIEKAAGKEANSGLTK